MKKIKVLHVLQSDKYSGAENVACQIIEMFNKDVKFDMAYCSVEGSIKNILEEKDILYYPLENLSVSELRKVIEDYQPNIIHSHDATATMISVLSSKRIPVLSHLHSNPPWMKKYKLKSIIYYLSSLKVKKILTVSNSVTKEYVLGDYIKEKEAMISNPLDLTIIRQKGELNKESSDIAKKNDVIFVGRLTEAKNPLRFINLIKKLKSFKPEISAVMVGDGDMRETCQAYITENGLDNNIELKGFLSNPYEVISDAKVLCMTSNWEGFGLVAVESLALGVPVVCPPVGGLKDLIDESCGKVCLNDFEFITEIKKIITEKEYRDRKVEGSLEKADFLENKDFFKRKLNNIYFEVVT